MMFKKRIIPLILTIVAASTLLVCKRPAEKAPPNIIYIMADDHASHAISAYNGIYAQVAPTPNIDRLASEGALFTNTFCTNSICGPSRATILTGKYSHQNGFYKNEGGDPFDGSQVTFPKLLKEAGYTTAVVGKWHLWSEPTGFDYYKYHVLNGEQGSYWNPTYNDNGQEVAEKGYASNFAGDFALDWLENQRDKSKPFCLLFQFKAPHRPWYPDSIYLDLFDGIEMPYPETFNDDYKGREQTAGSTMMTIENHLTRKDLKMTPPEGLTAKELHTWERTGDKGEFVSPSDTLTGMALKKWKYQKYIKDYLACVRSVDDNVGRLLAYLDESGLAENTIVIYTADQGFYLGDHGWYDKRFMYEESLRMPFVIRYPQSIEAGQEIEEMTLNVDFAPTLLDMAGVEIPDEMQGESFAQLLNGEGEEQWRDAIYYHYYEYPKWHHVQPHYGIRTDRYKLIHFYYDVDIWELYDLQEDPNELSNLYKDEVHSDLIASLKEELKKLQVLYGDDISLEEMREETRKGMVKYE
ncbi:MAG: sulfatase [Bacteroides sp.]|nr:sulfatase [Bacteroides sp.]